MAALVLIARAQLRRHFGSLLLIGLLAGLTGGTVVAATSVARRTATAEDRLAAATNADDVRSTAFGGTEATTRAIAEPVVSAPEVAHGRLAVGGVARVDVPGAVYLGILSGPRDWGNDVLSPVLVEGRLPDPDNPSEVVVNQAVLQGSQPLDIEVGDRFDLHLLTEEEFTNFDASTPLEGKGGDLPIEVVGVVRLTGAPDDLPPFWASPALAESDLEGIGVLGAALVQLRADVSEAEFARIVNEAGSDVERSTDIQEFPAMTVASTNRQARAATETTTGVLTTGLLTLAAVAGLIGVIVVAQAAFRQEAGARDAQHIEAAIGVPRALRVRARVLAAVPAAIVAAALTLAAGLVAGGIEPPGLLRVVEPHPGWAPNVLLVAVATAICPLVVLASIGLSAIRTPRRSPSAVREAPVVRWLSTVGGRPSAVLGLRFALERSSGPGGVSALTAIATLCLSLGGLVAALVFSASLDRLVATPVRWGAPTDLVIADAGIDVVDELRGDPRFDLVVAGEAADMLIDGRSTQGVVQEALRGELEWELRSGRPPATRDEIVLGTRLADELDKDIGDVVEARGRDNRDHTLSVVGVGVVPNNGGGELGRSAALTREGLEQAAAADPFPELGLGIREGVSERAVLEDLSVQRSYEAQPASLPREVANLEQIDRVPLAIAGFLGLLVVITLVHTITVVTRRRTHDLATVRALGFSRAQGRAIIVSSAGVTALVSSFIALPVGLVVGRTLWRLVAEGAAVLGDATYPPAVLLGLIPASLVIAVVAGSISARKALGGTISGALRAE